LQKERILRAIILAGGKGVRLAPLTEVIPKPLVPLGGMPILEIVVRQLKLHGFQRLTLAVGYMADLIRAYFQDGSKWGVDIEYSCEESPLGTAGPLALIKDLNETFLLMNADVLTNVNYNALLNFHRQHGGIATICACERQVQIDLGIIIKDGDVDVKDYAEKPVLRYLVSMGIYIFEPQVLDFIPPGIYLDFPDLVKLFLQANLSVKYFPFNGYWLDIGRHDDYAKAVAEFDTFKADFLSESVPQ
jgi:NDP-sugar pyrophosphorylase family protein